MIIKRINSTSTIAAPLFVLHIINHPPFYLFTLFYGNFWFVWLLLWKL